MELAGCCSVSSIVAYPQSLFGGRRWPRRFTFRARFLRTRISQLPATAGNPSPVVKLTAMELQLIVSVAIAIAVLASALVFPVGGVLI
jgi:hypothetical protein